MATYTEIPLSGSTDGRPKKIAATTSPGDTIHTATSSTTLSDKIWLWVTNTSGSAATLTIEFGGTSSPDDQVAAALSIAANTGPTLVVDGLILRNSLVLKAFSGTTNVLLLSGFVVRAS